MQTKINYLINVEKERADIDAYDERMINDPNRGHWDLFELDDEQINVNFGAGVYKRDPRLDVKQGGVIAIDFGTKGTVVVSQNDNNITMPMRVGIGKLRREVEAYQYENPTVMEFINLEAFMEQYKNKQGRPDTKWNTLTVSHTANNSALNSSSEHFYSYFSDLKQWCGTKSKTVNLRDKNNKIYRIPSFLEVDDDDINPIEIYAYYLGLYINNMFRGIYIDYMLSFPVTYETEIREKVLKSFEVGIKKALPMTITEDEEIMRDFRVVDGANEPAAYAITALQEFGFEPEDEEEVFYGVFDFGGGTTDFDFGLWREATGKKERRYDYVIEHFGAGGDRYLGGENLLELLAFEVFKENMSALIQDNVTFQKPVFCREFIGGEAITSDSEEAKLNMRILKEKLRPITEKHEGYESLYSKGMIGTNLYNASGTLLTNFSLDLDLDVLEKILEERIESGVKNFFESLRLAFVNEECMEKATTINIFLAGNSSKSEVVKSIFKKYIDIEHDEMKRMLGITNDVFVLFPPLGSDEAYDIQEAQGKKINRNGLENPTGKTGVAFGLIDSRKGGKIKVVNKDFIVSGESKFKYLVGYSKKRLFKTVIDREATYGEWVEFIDAGEEDFEIHYTDLPEASSGRLDIEETKRLKLRIEEENEDAYIYIRAVSPSKIEYVVADEDEIKEGKYLSEVVLIELV